MVKILLLPTQELDFLLYAEFECVDCCFLLLLFPSVDLDTDVKLPIPAHVFVCICFVPCREEGSAFICLLRNINILVCTDM